MPKSTNPYHNQSRNIHSSPQSSSSDRRRELESCLRNLRTAQSEINTQCELIERLISELVIEEDTSSDTDTYHSTSSHQSFPPQANRYQPRNTSTLYDSSSYSRVASKTTRPSPTPQIQPFSEPNPPPGTRRDSSFDRIQGPCAFPSSTVPANFDIQPPFFKGDIVEIQNKYKGQKGKQGVVDRESITFVYFSNDRAKYQRAPQNLKRIHISDYNPYK